MWATVRLAHLSFFPSDSDTILELLRYFFYSNRTLHFSSFDKTYLLLLYDNLVFYLFIKNKNSNFPECIRSFSLKVVLSV